MNIADKITVTVATLFASVPVSLYLILLATHPTDPSILALLSASHFSLAAIWAAHVNPFKFERQIWK